MVAHRGNTVESLMRYRRRMTPWGWAAIVVCILVAAFCVQLRCEGERSIAALERRVATLETRPPTASAPAAQRAWWWCTAPSIATVNRDLEALCDWSRHSCELHANIIGSTCVATDAPFCFDVGRSEKAEACQCYFDLPTCTRHRRDHLYARSNCYRATDGFAYEQARGHQE
jgi:hypothetical protein